VRQISSVQKVCVCARARAAHAVLDVFLSLSLPNRTCKSQTHSNTSFQAHHFSLTPLFCLSTAISQLNAAKAASMHEQEEVGSGSGKAHSGSYCLFGIKTENPCEKPVDFVKWVLS
jgi:hypothetical protein